MSETEHGYSPDVGEGSEEVKRAGDLAFRPEAAGEPGPGREPSAEEEPGVPVGESLTRSGEELAGQKREPGREQAGVKGESDRPYGGSTLEDSTGVAPEGPIDEESPPLPSGDQGG